MCKDVCVIIPSYKNKEHLSKSLGSILRQKNIQLEVIIIDNGCCDDTSDWLNHIIHRYDFIRVIKHYKANIANARNLAIEKSNCKFITFLDAGDAWYDNKLANQLQFMKTHPNCILTFTNYLNVESHYQPIIDCFSYLPEFSKLYSFANNEYIQLNAPLNILLENNIIGFSTVMAKKEVLMKSGFDPSLKSASDWDCWLRLAMLGDFYFSHEITTENLITTNSTVKFHDKHLDALAEIIKRISAHPDIQPSTVKHAQANLNESLADHHRQLGHKASALKHALQALLLYPHKRNIKHFFHDIKQLVYI